MDEGRSRADFVVEAPDRGVQLVVEVMNTVAPTPEWPARFLRNLFGHAVVPHSEFFLLVLRDHLYLWRRPDPQGQRPPDFQADTSAVLGSYLRAVPNRLETMSERGFEMLVYFWLADLVAGAEPEPEASNWLESSGLLGSLRNGTVKTQLAA